MVEKVKAEVLTAIRARLAAKGISSDSDFSAYPVGGVCEDSVPFIGTIHIPAKRVVKRSESNRLFSGLKR